MGSIVSMYSKYSTLEHTILKHLKENPEVGQKTKGLAASEVHSNLPNASHYTYEQVAQTIRVLALEGLVRTDGFGKLVDITREGLIAAREDEYERV